MPHLPWEMMRPAYNLNPRIELTGEQWTSGPVPCPAVQALICYRDGFSMQMGGGGGGRLRQESMGNPWVQGSVSL
jgi:hypothetical protein